MKFRDATLDDVAAIAGLQNAAAGALTARYGSGPWSALVTERGATLAQRHARVYARCGFTERGRIVYKGDPLVYFERLLR